MKKWHIIAGLLAIISLATSCIVINNPSPAPAGELTILSHSMTKLDSGAVEVNAAIKNTGSTLVDFAQVEVEFYDASGTLVETSTDGIFNLERGESWDFTITCSGAGCHQVTNYKVTATATTSSGSY